MVLSHTVSEICQRASFGESSDLRYRKLVTRKLDFTKKSVMIQKEITHEITLLMANTVCRVLIAQICQTDFHVWENHTSTKTTVKSL